MEDVASRWKKVDISNLNIPQKSENIKATFKSMQDELLKSYEQISVAEQRSRESYEKSLKEEREKVTKELKNDIELIKASQLSDSAEVVEYQKKQAKALETVASSVKFLVTKKDDNALLPVIPIIQNIASSISEAADRIVEMSAKNMEREKNEEPEKEKPTRWRCTVTERDFYNLIKNIEIVPID